MLGISTVQAVVALAIFIFFWAGVLMVLGFGTRLRSLFRSILGSKPTPRRVKLPEMYKNMRNCTLNDVWIDGKGVPHKLSILRRIVLWLKFHNPLSRVRRMIRMSGIRKRDFRRGPVGAGSGVIDQCGRDMSGLRQNFWGSQAADPVISSAMMPGDTYHNSGLNHLRHLNQAMTAWLSDTASGGNATLVVAAVNSLHPERADYQCDGVDDQITINSAISALPTGPVDYLLGGGLGGKVLLLEGDYYVNATGAVDANQSAIYFTRGDVDLCGVGSGSRIHLNNGQNCSVIGCISGAGIPPVSIHDLYIDGNLTNNPGVPAILFSGGIRVAEPPAPAYYCQRVKIYNNYITNCRRLGIIARGDDCQIFNNFVIDCAGDLIEGLGFQVDIHDNTCRSLNVRGLSGIGVDGAQYAILKNNIVYANNMVGFMNGLYVMGGSTHVVVDGNQVIIGTAGTILNHPVWLEVGPERVIFINNIIWPSLTDPASLIQASNVIMENNYFRGGSLEFNAAAATATAPIELKRNRFEGTTLVYTAGTVHTDFWSTDFASTASVTCGIQEAINALPATGGEVFIPAGTHTVTQPILPRDHVTLRNAGTIRVSNAVTSLLAANANAGQPNITVANGALFKVGDWVVLKDNNGVAHYAHVYGDSDRVNAVVGNVVTLDHNLVHNFTVAAAGVLSTCHSAILIDTKDDVKIIGGFIDGNIANQSPFSPITLQVPDIASEENRCMTGITAITSTNITYDGVVAFNCNMFGLYMSDVHTGTINKCRTYGNFDGGIQGRGNSVASGGVLQYDIDVTGCFSYSQVNEDGIIFYGLNTHISIEHCHAWSNPRYGIMGGNSATAYNFTFTGNVVRGNGYGIAAFCNGFTIIGNTAYGNASYGIYINQSGASGGTVSGNTSRNNTSGGIALLGAPRDIDLSANYCFGNGNYGILLASDGGVHPSYINMNGNTCNDNGSDGFRLMVSGGNGHINLLGNTARFTGIAGQLYGLRVDANCPGTGSIVTDNDFSGNQTADILDNSGGTWSAGLRPRPVQSIQCFLARATNNVLAAAGNGAWPALAQPDAISGRNLEAQCFNGGGGGIGTVTVTGTTQFGAAVVATHTFAGAATFVMPEIFATINLNAVVLTGLAGGDTISVGYGNKVGVDHKGFVGFVKKVFKSGVGDIAGLFVEDAVYHGVTMPANIAPNEIYAIQSLNCLA